MQIQNVGDEPITIQAHIAAWNAKGGEEILSDNDDILLNPPIFTVAVGHAQYLRLGLRHSPQGASEGTYRLILEQVPGPPKPDFMGISTLLKISVPIFVKPRIAAPQLVWTLERTTDRDMRLAVENHGNAHVQILKFAITFSGSDAESFGQNLATYVLPNARKEWLIHSGILAASGKMLLLGQTDNGDLREDLVLSRP
jgi:fimbrial chaperone protein